MAGPYYNSRATQISVVIEGEGYFEMACPHRSSSGSRGQREGSGSSGRRSRSGPSYQQSRGRLRRGTVFVAPAGHPVAVIASRNKNLQVLCFEVNAQGNVRFPLAGISCWNNSKPMKLLLSCFLYTCIVSDSDPFSFVFS